MKLSTVKILTNDNIEILCQNATQIIEPLKDKILGKNINNSALCWRQKEQKFKTTIVADDCGLFLNLNVGGIVDVCCIEPVTMSSKVLFSRKNMENFNELPSDFKKTLKSNTFIGEMQINKNFNKNSLIVRNQTELLNFYIGNTNNTIYIIKQNENYNDTTVSCNNSIKHIESCINSQPKSDFSETIHCTFLPILKMIVTDFEIKTSENGFSNIYTIKLEEI